MIKLMLLKLICVYQKTISPDHGAFSFLRFLPTFTQHSCGVCKFRPTCSQYCFRAVEKYGVIKGLSKGMQRIIRCHPWSRGGWDPA